MLYSPAALPPEFIAPRVSSMQNVDFSRLARAISNNNMLYPGDMVRITVATGLETETPPEWKGRIGDDGMVTVPLIGAVQLAGLEMPQAEQMIRAESIRRGKFVDPTVSVVLDRRRMNRVTVVGAVEEPGTYELSAENSHVLQAITQAGGPTQQADTIVEVRHPPGVFGAELAQQPGGSTQLTGWQRNRPVPPPRTFRIDLEQVPIDGSADYSLRDGSTVMVMPRPKRYIHVIGLVNQANQFEMPENTDVRLLDAIAMAGNRKLEIADKVHVIRQVPGRAEPVVIEASIREAKLDGASNIRLAPGDVVSVEETPTTFVIGTMRDLFRFGFSSAIPGF